MRQNKGNTLLKPKFSPDFFEDDDLRIDWERKKLKKDRTEDEIEDELLEADDDLLDEFEVEADDEWVFSDAPKKQQRGKHKKGKRDKRRHLVFDEDSGRVIVKRRRKQNRYDDVWFEDHD